MAGFTFDSPFRIVPGQDSQQVASRKTVKKRLPSSRKEPPPSFITKARRRTLSFIQGNPATSTANQKQTPASPFPFLSLPLRVRQQVYGYVIGGNEKLHILRKHRPAKDPPAIGYRRCRAAISGKSCAGGKCREMSILDGVYCGVRKFPEYFFFSVAFLSRCDAPFMVSDSQNSRDLRKGYRI